MNAENHFYVEIGENETEATSQAKSIRIDHQLLMFELLFLFDVVGRHLNAASISLFCMYA